MIDTIMSAADEFPARFERSGDLLTLEAVVAQRKLFLSRRTLTYRCRLRVDDAARRVTFYEVLVEKGEGVEGDGDLPAGLGFRKEKYKAGATTRSGSIQQQARLFGRRYDFSFRYERVRQAVECAAQIAGYEVKTVLREKSV